MAEFTLFNIKKIVRSFHGPIPNGSMILVEFSDDCEHIERFIYNNLFQGFSGYIIVVLDQPDDDIVRFELPIEQGAIPDSLIRQSQDLITPTENYRDRAIWALGRMNVDLIESFSIHFAQYLNDYLKGNLPQNWVFLRNQYSRPSVKLSWSPNRRSSYGGPRGLSLALHDPVLCSQHFIEYPRIANDPEIGSTPTSCWQHNLAILISHEMAHFFQRSGYIRNGPEMGKPHGEGWQFIYRIFRRHIVNPHRDTNFDFIW